MTSILVYGYGNPGRQDDGLGPALVSELEVWLTVNPDRRITLDSNYQLNAEDALAVSGHDGVIFVDATQAGEAPYEFRSLVPEKTIAFSTHAMTSATVLALCEELYDKHPAAWILTIRGYSWELNANLTPEASANLVAASEFIKLHLSRLCDTL
jgi:hydrogenase maturation protease